MFFANVLSNATQLSGLILLQVLSTEEGLRVTKKGISYDLLKFSLSHLHQMAKSLDFAPQPGVW